MGDITPASDNIYDIENYRPRSGRIIGEDGKAYNLVDILLSGNLGSGNGGNNNGTGAGLFTSVPIYADLPQPVSEYTDKLYFVQESSGGLLAFMGAYKYPRGFYAVNLSNTWEQVPISVSVSDNAFTIANITDWTGFKDYTGTVNQNDMVLYNGALYQNLTDAITDIPPNADTTNWRIVTANDSALFNGKQDAEFVQTTGDQNIQGRKTFAASPKVTVNGTDRTVYAGYLTGSTLYLFSN